MRTRLHFFFGCWSFTGALVAPLLAAGTASAQVSDGERAGARELFMQGDALQRDGHFTEALDKFQRAQQVYGAPTNVLRIAECDAALGRLVESAEAYREVLRTPLPPGAPPAFQGAVEQARAELSQVEPRIPKLTVRVQPVGVQGPQMQIDGQNVPAALLGEPVPLDPGTHKISVIAPGYAMTEGAIELKEHETKTAAVNLNAIPGVTYAPATAAAPAPPRAEAAADPPAPPPPPPDAAAEPRHSSLGLLFGLHLGAEGAAGTVPNSQGNDYVSASDYASGGVSFGLDGAFRFGRRWMVGLTVDHAGLNSGNTAATSSNTTLLAANIAFTTNPDRVGFYAELGVGERWFTEHDARTGTRSSIGFQDAAFDLGLGIWIPAGRYVRILPKFTVSLSSLKQTNDSGSGDSGTSDDANVVTVWTLGVSGFYNLDL